MIVFFHFIHFSMSCIKKKLNYSWHIFFYEKWTIIDHWFHNTCLNIIYRWVEDSCWIAQELLECKSRIWIEKLIEIQTLDKPSSVIVYSFQIYIDLIKKWPDMIKLRKFPFEISENLSTSPMSLLRYTARVMVNIFLRTMWKTQQIPTWNKCMCEWVSEWVFKL